MLSISALTAHRSVPSNPRFSGLVPSHKQDMVDIHLKQVLQQREKNVAFRIKNQTPMQLLETLEEIAKNQIALDSQKTEAEKKQSHFEQVKRIEQQMAVENKLQTQVEKAIVDKLRHYGHNVVSSYLAQHALDNLSSINPIKKPSEDHWGKPFPHPSYQTYSTVDAQKNFTSTAVLNHKIEVKDLTTYILKLMQEIEKLSTYHCNDNKTQDKDNFWNHLVDLANNPPVEISKLRQFGVMTFNDHEDRDFMPSVGSLEKLSFAPSLLARLKRRVNGDDSLPVERVVNQNWTEETKKLADKK